MGYKTYSNITCPKKRFFVNTKFTKCKTSRTLQINVFEIQIIKILENCFQNMNCFYWIKLIPVLIYLQFWYYNFPQLELPCFPHHPCHISPYPTETSLQHNPHHVFYRFPYLGLPHLTTRHHKYWINKTYAKPTQWNFLSSYIQILIPYGSNTLHIKNWVFKRRSSFKFRQHGEQ